MLLENGCEPDTKRVNCNPHTPLCERPLVAVAVEFVDVVALKDANSKSGTS